MRMESSQDLVIPRGFRAGAVKAGIKPSGGLDLALLVADGPCAAAGTFTTNRVCAAPVRWCRDHLPADDIRAVVINAGNATRPRVPRVWPTSRGPPRWRRIS